MGKQMEGDNQQRRAKAAEARDEGVRPSEAGVTTGASGQRRHLGGEASHAEKIDGPGWGKQQPDRASPDPRPGSLRDREAPPATEPPVPGRAPRRDDLTEQDGRVFETVVRLEVAGDDGGTVEDIARESGLDTDTARTVVRRLMRTHDVVQEVGDRYRVKARA